jgi:tetratricopeptide (TPR) repeat protein
MSSTFRHKVQAGAGGPDKIFAVAAKASREECSRAGVRRQFGLTERQLQSWERLDLIPAAQSYSFSDLIAIQTLAKLRESRIPARQICRALASLRSKLEGVKQPLSEVRIVADNRKITVRIAGQRMEAITGQILFDFEAEDQGGVRSFPVRKDSSAAMMASEACFEKGLHLEETGAPVEQAIEAYQKAIDWNPAAAGALVNLGTIYYRMRKFAEAEKYYQQAVQAGGGYALAEFNLGNLYDEQNRIRDAFTHYRRALSLDPNYADAHFNLALLCERTGDALKAVQHWKAYLKLDSRGEWAEIARRQLERLRQATLVHSR